MVLFLSTVFVSFFVKNFVHVKSTTVLDIHRTCTHRQVIMCGGPTSGGGVVPQYAGVGAAGVVSALGGLRYYPREIF